MTDGISGNYNFTGWTQTGNPDNDLRSFMKLNPDLSEEEAKAVLEGRFGKPQPPQPGMVNGNVDMTYRPPRPDISGLTNEQIASLPKGFPPPPPHPPQGFSMIPPASDSEVRPELERGVPSNAKQAKAWMKKYSETHNCSKKEAEHAYVRTFGQEPPKTFWQKLFG